MTARQIHVGECSDSAITRMELLGFQNITKVEEALISQKLDRLTYLPLTENIENAVIGLRQARKIKLPDAIIAATALCLGLELLTLDQHILSVVNSSAKLS